MINDEKQRPKNDQTDPYPVLKVDDIALMNVAWLGWHIACSCQAQQRESSYL